jgi:hypothetical protein
MLLLRQLQQPAPPLGVSAVAAIADADIGCIIAD